MHSKFLVAFHSKVTSSRLASLSVYSWLNFTNARKRNCTLNEHSSVFIFLLVYYLSPSRSKVALVKYPMMGNTCNGARTNLKSGERTAIDIPARLFIFRLYMYDSWFWQALS